SWDEGDGIGEVEPGKEQIPADEERRHAWDQQDAGVTAERFHHATRPTLALAREYVELVRRVGETARVLCMADSPPAREHRPGEHDIFANAFDPTADLFQRFALVNRKSA